MGDVRQQILVGQIRAKQEAEQEQLHAGLQVEDGRSLLAVPISVPPSLLCSLLCSLCDMMESMVFGVLSPLLETRGSYKGLEARIRKLPCFWPLIGVMVLLPASLYAHICPGSATGLCVCPLPCGGQGLHPLDVWSRGLSLLPQRALWRSSRPVNPASSSLCAGAAVAGGA